MRIISPEFRFRGNRDYINAASIYEAIVENTRGAGLPDVDGEVRLTIRKLVRKQLEIHYGDPRREIPRPPEAAVDFKIVAGGAAVFGWMTETDRDVVGRTPYDEEEMAALSAMQGTLLRVEGVPVLTRLLKWPPRRPAVSTRRSYLRQRAKSGYS